MFFVNSPSIKFVAIEAAPVYQKPLNKVRIDNKASQKE
jgi:hypothetical protein